MSLRNRPFARQNVIERHVVPQKYAIILGRRVEAVKNYPARRSRIIHNKFQVRNSRGAVGAVGQGEALVSYCPKKDDVGEWTFEAVFRKGKSSSCPSRRMLVCCQRCNSAHGRGHVVVEEIYIQKNGPEVAKIWENMVQKIADEGHNICL